MNEDWDLLVEVDGVSMATSFRKARWAQGGRKTRPHSETERASGQGSRTRKRHFQFVVEEVLQSELLEREISVRRIGTGE